MKSSTQVNWTGNVTNHELPCDGHCDVQEFLFLLRVLLTNNFYGQGNDTLPFRDYVTWRATLLKIIIFLRVAQTKWLVNENMKIWPYPPNLGLLRKVVLAPELPMKSADNSLHPVSQLNYSFCPLLLPLPHFQRFCSWRHCLITVSKFTSQGFQPAVDIVKSEICFIMLSSNLYFPNRKLRPRIKE